MSMLNGPELVVDLGALANNWRALDALSGSAETAAMVKANGYGVGAQSAVDALRSAGCNEFFVADVNEGVALREAFNDLTIYVLAGAPHGTVDALKDHALVPTLLDLGQLERWRKANPTPAPASLHIDSGMNRTGLDQREYQALLERPDLLADLDVHHVMSHLACAEDVDPTHAATQIDRFHEIRRQFPQGRGSLANTAGIALGHRAHFDHVRPGIGLYGADPTPNRTLGIQPVVALRAPVLQIRNIAAGQTVGYGATWVAQRPTTVATVGVGYGDGWLRAQSNHGAAAVSGERVPLIGRVSMDLVTLDVSDLTGPIKVGDPVELIGPNVPIEDVAAAAGTIPYEILTSLSARYQRSYVN